MELKPCHCKIGFGLLALAQTIITQYHHRFVLVMAMHKSLGFTTNLDIYGTESLQWQS